MALQLFKIETVEVASPVASVDFQNIPQGYTDLMFLISAKGATNGGSLFMKFNTLTAGSFKNLFGDGNGSYSNQNTGFVNLNYIPDGTTTPGTYGNASIYIPNYASTTTNKSLSVDGVTESNATTAYANFIAGLWDSNSAINRLTLQIGGGGNIGTGSTFTLYGVL
jgi:hypothetical protein